MHTGAMTQPIKSGLHRFSPHFRTFLTSSDPKIKPSALSFVRIDAIHASVIWTDTIFRNRFARSNAVQSMTYLPPCAVISSWSRLTHARLCTSNLSSGCHEGNYGLTWESATLHARRMLADDLSGHCRHAAKSMQLRASCMGCEITPSVPISFNVVQMSFVLWFLSLSYFEQNGMLDYVADTWLFLLGPISITHLLYFMHWRVLALAPSEFTRPICVVSTSPQKT